MRDFVKREIDNVFEKSMIVSAYIYNVQTKRWFKELDGLKSYSSFVNLSPFTNNALQKLLEKSMILSSLLGVDSMQKEIKVQVDKYGKTELSDNINIRKLAEPQTGFDEAIRVLKAKNIVTPEAFKEGSATIKSITFSIQKIERLSALEAVKTSLLKAIDTGMDFAEWKNNEMLQIFAKQGITPLSPHHLETIFRTNIGTAYEIARNDTAIKDPNVQGWERMGISDSRQSQVCNNLDGEKHPKDDPIWEHISPLSHYKCRCTKIPITLGYMKANNVKWDKKPGKKTLDLVGKDFRNNPKSLKEYSDRINKRLVDLEKTNIDLNEMLKKQNN